MAERTSRQELVERIAKAVLLREGFAPMDTFSNKTKRIFREEAEEWLTALRKAGLVVSVKPKRKRAVR